MLLFMEMLLYFLNQVTAVAFIFSGDDLDVFRINAQSCQLGFHSTASKFTIKMQQTPGTFSVPFRYYRKIYGLFPLSPFPFPLPFPFCLFISMESAICKRVPNLRDMMLVASCQILCRASNTVSFSAVRKNEVIKQ